MLPLDGASASDPERGGFGYLDWSDYQRGWHEGVDLNAGSGIDGDLGLALVSLCPMQLVFSGETSRGFGRHQWWEVLADGPFHGAHVHYAHANSFEHEEIGTVVHRGEKIGECGKSGGQYAAHLHLAVTKAKPDYWQWYGSSALSKEAVDAYTHNPYEWWQWCDANEGSFSVLGRADTVTPEDDMTDEERAALAAIRDSGYPITEIPDLVRACATWSANAASLSGWIEKIGALESAVNEKDARIAELIAEAESAARNNG